MPTFKREQAEAVDLRFRSESERWDRIYSNSGSLPARLWDRWTRQNVRLRFRRTFELAGELTGKTVLDLGCGSGRYLVEAARRGASRVVGVDTSPEMLTIAECLTRPFASKTTIELRCEDARRMKWGEPFDLVCANGVFDYLDNAELLLEAVAHGTRGLFVASFPDESALRAQPRRLYWRLRGLRIHLFNRSRIEALVERSGMRVLAIERLGPVFLLSADSPASS